MTSEIRANTLKNRVGLGTVSFTNTGPVVSGIITANSFSGTGDLDVDGHTNLDNVSIAGVTTANVLNFGDSNGSTTNIAKFGASGDLVIYHNGNHSKVIDVGTGNLYLESDVGSIFLRVSDNEQGVTINQDGDVQLYYNNNLKLSTTNSGISVNGNIAATGNLTPGGTLYLTDAIEHTDDSNTKIRFPAADTISFTTDNSERVKIFSNGGTAISNAGSFPTSTNETLTVRGEGHNGHGTTYTRSVFNITAALTSRPVNGGGGLWVGARTNEDTAVIGTRTANGNLAIETHNSGWGERLRIDSTGRVLIGTTSANQNNKIIARLSNASLPNTSTASVILAENSGNAWITIGSGASNYGGILFADSGSSDIGQVRYDHSTNALEFLTNGGNSSNIRLRIDSNGYMGLGTLLASDPGSAGAGLKIEKYVQRNNIYAFPDGWYGASLGEVQNTENKVWASIDSHYARSSAISAGLFLSAFHQDAGGSGCGSAIKNLKAGNALTFSTVTTGASVGTVAVETERLRITSGGHISQGGGAEPSSTNGAIGLKHGIKSSANNVIIGETTQSGSGYGLHIESRQTGRSGSARIAQIGMKNDSSGNGQISFFTSPSGADVSERMVINSAGQVQVKGNDATGLSGGLFSVNNEQSGAGISLIGTGGSWNEAGWAQISDGGLIRSSANANGGLNFQAASGDMRFYAGNTSGSPTYAAERLRIYADGNIQLLSDNGNNSDTPGIIFRGGNSTQKANFAKIHSRMVSGWGGQIQFKVKNDTGSLADAYQTAMIMDHNAVIRMPNQCGFHMIHDGNQSLSSGDMITNWDTDASSGKSYIKNCSFNSGRFVAPVDGLYFFTAQLLLMQVATNDDGIHIIWTTGSGNNSFSYWNTRHDGSAAHGSYGYGTYLPVTGSTTVYLSAGDIFGIRASFSGAIGIYGTDSNWGHWSGYLVG